MIMFMNKIDQHVKNVIRNLRSLVRYRDRRKCGLQGWRYTRS